MSTKQRILSMATRVLLFVALAITLCLLLLGTMVQTSIEGHFAEQDAEELQVVYEVVQQTLQRYPERSAQQSSALAQAVSGHHGVYFQVNDHNGQLLYALPGANLSELLHRTKPVAHLSPDHLYSWRQGEHLYRGSVLKAGNFLISTAIDMGFHAHFLSHFRQSLWSIMAGAGVLTLFAAWLGVRQGHLPLHELSQTILAIQSDKLQTRLDPAMVPIELKELVLSFNHMIGQLEEGFARLSHFSADIAHELRTPLTNLITQTQVALGSERTASEYRELLYSNLEEQERLAKMVSDMLWLAQTERGLIKPVFVSLNLTDEVRALFDFFEAWVDEKKIQLTLDSPEVWVKGDRAMLRRALSNLLSNAIHHTSTGSTVSVNITQPEAQRVQITVHNPGKKIPHEHLSRLFDRFYRVDPSRQRQIEGAGLGLAIVKSIIELHVGTVKVNSDEHGTTFTLLLHASTEGVV